MQQIQSGVPRAKAWKDAMDGATSAGKRMAVQVMNGKVSMDALTASTNASKIAMIGMQAATMLLNAALMAGIAVAIGAITTAIDKYIHRVDYAVKAAKDAKDNFKSLAGEIEGIEAEIDSINDLKLEITDDAELEKLQAQTEELERQKELKETLARIAKQESANTAAEALGVKGYQVESGVTYDGVVGVETKTYKEANIIDFTRDLLKQREEIAQKIKDANAEFDKIMANDSLSDDKKSKAAQAVKTRIDNLKTSYDSLNATIGTNTAIIDENYTALSADGVELTDAQKSLMESAGNFLDEFRTVSEQTESAVEEVAKSVADEMSEAASGAEKSVKAITDNITAVQTALAAQTTGKSIGVEDYQNLKQYAEALEYVNGSYQLNAEKVRELVEAKTEEQRATNDANKALAQSTYLENAGQIEQLRQKIVDKNFAEGESAETIQATIDSLLSENDALSGVITQYDLMNASLDEATSAYQNWINAQSATQTGAMFDSAVTAAKKINDTINKKDSDDYGRIGNADYKAAVEFVLPEGVDSQDTEAVNKYLKSLSKVMTLDDNGNFTGLNIEKFCERAVEKGLMVLEGDEFKIAGEMSMKDFADGIGYSLPFVQAAFGEMQEFGGDFTWADEATKTVGDLGVAAVKAAEHLRSIKDNSDLKLILDVSSFEDKKTAIETLQSDVDQLNDYKATLSVDSTEYEEANTIIQYCIAQKQILTQPDVMTVDTSKVTGDLSEVLSLLQQFQSAQDTIEMKAAVGADTSEAEKELADLQTKLQGVDIPAGLNIDTSSIETIKTSIAAMDAEMIVKAGVDPSLVEAYQDSEHKTEGTVIWDNEKSKVDSYIKEAHTAQGKVIWGNNTVNVKTSFTATGTIKWSGSGASANGTAHAGGTAYAGGNWGTATGGKTLVGELGRKVFATLYGDI